MLFIQENLSGFADKGSLETHAGLFVDILNLPAGNFTELLQQEIIWGPSRIVRYIRLIITGSHKASSQGLFAE